MSEVASRLPVLLQGLVALILLCPLPPVLCRFNVLDDNISLNLERRTSMTLRTCIDWEMHQALPSAVVCCRVLLTRVVKALWTDETMATGSREMHLPLPRNRHGHLSSDACGQPQQRARLALGAVAVTASHTVSRPCLIHICRRKGMELCEVHAALLLHAPCGVTYACSRCNLDPSKRPLYDSRDHSMVTGRT